MPSPQVRKGPAGPDQLPQGAATKLNDAYKLAEQQKTPKEAGRSQSPKADLTGFDKVVFGPTYHPEEPATTGAPFGSGTNFVRNLDDDDDDTFLSQAAVAIANSPAATSRVKAFAARIARGE